MITSGISIISYVLYVFNSWFMQTKTLGAIMKLQQQ